MNEFKQKINKFSHSEIFMYLICGALTTLLSFIIFFGSYNFFVSINLISFQINNKDSNWVIANLISFCLSTIFAYFINKIFVFNNTDYKTATIVKELAKFFAGRILGYILFDLGLMALLIYVLNLNVTVSKLISCIFIIVFNYVASKLFVFVNSDELTKNGKFIALFFDPTLCDNSTFYGYEIIEAVLDTISEICKYRIIWYQGDVIEKLRYVDITTRLVYDEFLTVNSKTHFGDWPFCIALDNVKISDIKLIDDKIKKSVKSYKGLSTINRNTIDLEKQFFYRYLIKEAEITGNDLIVYRDEYSDKTLLESIAIEKGFHCKQKFQYDDLIDSIYNSHYVSAKGKSTPLSRNIMLLNFSLNVEVGIAGSILWDSIEKLCNIKFEQLSSNNRILLPENAFLCLYYASQGIERLQKILIELIIKKEGIGLNEENEIVNLLYNHNHMSMGSYIKKYYKCISDDSNILLEVLYTFYNKCRYLNYNITKPLELDELDNLFNRFANKNCTNESECIKNSFGSKLGKYSRYLFHAIKDLSLKLNINVDEQNYDSKAIPIFYDTEVNLYKMMKKYTNFKKEIVYSLIKNDKNMFKYDKLPFNSLDIDKSNVFEYMTEILLNGNTCYDGEIDALYDEECAKDKKMFKERLDFMDELFESMIYYVD